MNAGMQKELDELMGTWALSIGSASDPSDREKLRDFFIRWYEQGTILAVADWEAYLSQRGWDREAILEVRELPEDVAAVARRFGH